MTNDDLPPLPVGMKGIDDLWDHVYEYTHISEGTHERLERVCHAYAHTARAPLLAEIEQLRAVAKHYPESNERMKACIADVRQSVKSVLAYRRSDDYSRGVRAQAVYTLAILDGHAADGGGDDR